jgi:glucose-6-phosphate dehydrogenase assembly protein OpcA
MTVAPGVVLARIDEELRALWATPAVAGEPLKSRACTMNLVVVAATPALADQCVAFVDEVVKNVPARAIVVGLDPDGRNELEASVSAVCAPDPGGRTIVCSERVTLVARGALCNRLSSCVQAICATDVPTTLVWLARVHSDDPAFEPLARGARRVVLDAGQSSIASLSHAVRWARGRPEDERPGVADLVWSRLASWQELCARMFDPPRLRGLVRRVTRVSLLQACPTGAALAPEGALLLGWMATRLGWKTASLAGKLRLVRPDGGYVQTQVKQQPVDWAPKGSLLGLEMEASADGTTLVGEVARQDAAQAAWRVRVSSDGETQHLEQHIRLRPTGVALVLERTLHRPPQDDALADAAIWADELRGEELAGT